MDAAAVSTSLDSALGFQLCLGFGVTPHRTRTLIQFHIGMRCARCPPSASQQRCATVVPLEGGSPAPSDAAPACRPSRRTPFARYAHPGTEFGSLLEM